MVFPLSVFTKSCMPPRSRPRPLRSKTSVMICCWTSACSSFVCSWSSCEAILFMVCTETKPRLEELPRSCDSLTSDDAFDDGPHGRGGRARVDQLVVVLLQLPLQRCDVIVEVIERGLRVERHLCFA